MALSIVLALPAFGQSLPVDDGSTRDLVAEGFQVDDEDDGSTLLEDDLASLLPKDGSNGGATGSGPLGFDPGSTKELAARLTEPGGDGGPQVPEPSTWMLLAAGLAAAFWFRRARP